MVIRWCMDGDCMAWVVNVLCMNGWVLLFWWLYCWMVKGLLITDGSWFAGWMDGWMDR